MLNETNDPFFNRVICCFEKGRYKDVMKMVYEDLLMMGVSTKNIEKVITTFSIFCKLHACGEANGLAQYQIAFEFGDCCDIRPCTHMEQAK